MLEPSDRVSSLSDSITNEVIISKTNNHPDTCEKPIVVDAEARQETATIIRKLLLQFHVVIVHIEEQSTKIVVERAKQRREGFEVKSEEIVEGLLVFGCLRTLLEDIGKLSEYLTLELFVRTKLLSTEAHAVVSNEPANQSMLRGIGIIRHALLDELALVPSGVRLVELQAEILVSIWVRVFNS
ncbi:hypothetical protein AC579_5526 [Pseudocercospora musae]|uniref:Uncharacterized protein n=1 Tax=Pseudocercospora musae TaxID=113226 RepID=A0A139IM50_9PEZI|nr:hypothetical protein AC579_5526 [Pseudocercospora musae]